MISKPVDRMKDSVLLMSVTRRTVFYFIKIVQNCSLLVVPCPRIPKKGLLIQFHKKMVNNHPNSFGDKCTIVTIMTINIEYHFLNL